VEPDGPELFASWQAMVRVCERVLGSRDDAEDCASEALLQAFADGLDDVENVEAWLVAIAKRRATDVLRRRVRHRRQLIRLASRCDVSDADHADRVADEAEARWLSGKADELLTAPARAVLRVVADGGTVNDAAHRLAMSRRSAESHLHRARVTLRAARVAVPAFAMAVLRSVRRPAAASSVALVATVAVVAPGMLAPNEPGTPSHAVVTTPVVSSDTSSSPVAAGVAEGVATKPRAAVPVRVSRPVVGAAVPAPPAQGGMAASVPSSSRVLGVIWTDDGSAEDPVGAVVDCVERFEALRGTIGC
jgi:RNA polymerase sigma factor (sigma-70 family)